MAPMLYRAINNGRSLAFERKTCGAISGKKKKQSTPRSKLDLYRKERPFGLNFGSLEREAYCTYTGLRSNTVR